MSFLDNLENNLNALERQEEKDPEKEKRAHERREAERTAALRRAPHVEALKDSAFTSELLTQCRTVGHAQRTLVQFVWAGETLRLDAKTKRMELTPTEDGITATCFLNGEETGRTTVDTKVDDAAALARRWLEQ
jgi:hypothetical protein